MTEVIALDRALRMPRLVYDPEETQIEDVMLWVPSPLILYRGALRTEREMIKLAHGGKTN